MPILTTLTITMDDMGNINVNGPIDNKLLCYGLCDVAKEIVFTHNQKKAESPIISGAGLRIVGPGGGN